MPRGTILEHAGRDAQDLKAPIRCPAGLAIQPGGLPGCLCRIEDSVISSASDPLSLVAFCAGEYTNCPTWVREKQHRLISKKLREMNRPVKRQGTLLDTWREGDDVPAFALPPE